MCKFSYENGKLFPTYFNKINLDQRKKENIDVAEPDSADQDDNIQSTSFRV